MLNSFSKSKCVVNLLPLIINFSKIHYSIIIQGKPFNGSFYWENPYRFNNPFITMMKVLFTPNADPLFSNIDQTNTVSNGMVNQSCLIKDTYTLAHIITIDQSNGVYIILNIQFCYQVQLYPDEFQLFSRFLSST